MSSLSPPPPDGGKLYELLMLQLQQKPQHTKDEQRAVQWMLKFWFPNKSLCLKVLFHNPGLMFNLQCEGPYSAEAVAILLLVKQLSTK